MLQVINRKPEFDILKGILIIFVVIGHTSIHIPYINIYWFHMPAFFMITGYLTKNWLTPQEVFISIKNKNYTIFKKIGKYIFPYLSYSVVFFILFQPESLIKNLARVLYGGVNNTTVYSYPFWYINSLFIATLAIGGGKLFKQNRANASILLIVWILLHCNIMRLFPIPLPWGMDAALGAVIFLCIGNAAKEIKSKTWHWYLLILPFIFIIFNEYASLHYKFNMKSMVYDHFILDLCVPVFFTYFFYKVSIILSHTQGFSYLLSYLGTCSMTIYFTHAAILSLTRKELQWNDATGVVSAIVIGALLHTLFKHFRITRILFIGNLK